MPARIDIRFQRARAMRWGRVLASLAVAKAALLEAEQGMDLEPSVNLRNLTAQIIEAERRLWGAWSRAHKAGATDGQ